MKLTYHRCGDYLLPDLTLPDEPVVLGKYSRMRKTYLKEHMPKPSVSSVTWHDTDEDDAESDGSSPIP